MRIINGIECPNWIAKALSIANGNYADSQKTIIFWAAFQQSQSNVAELKIENEQLQNEVSKWEKCKDDCSPAKSYKKVIKLQSELEARDKEILNLKASLLWSHKFDQIVVKDLREFLDSLKENK